MSQDLQDRIKVPLLILRVTLGLFLLQWGTEKLILPEQTARIFGYFYFIEGLPTVAAYVLGVLQILIALAIVFGFMRNISYLLGFLIHAVSTVSTAKHIFMPFMFDGWQHLFFTGVPVLAAFWLLYRIRDYDVLSMDGKKASSASPSQPPG
ncbi:MAG: DoxX family protein [Alphaproteobacteria bacterium]|nr:DoxX family protein [Alphaproteobacteria bacterium]